LIELVAEEDLEEEEPLMELVAGEDLEEEEPNIGEYIAKIWR
jgi:hypothetical protein